MLLYCDFLIQIDSPGKRSHDHKDIIQAWIDGYVAAIPMVTDILPGTPDKAFQKEIEGIMDEVKKTGTEQL